MQTSKLRNLDDRSFAEDRAQHGTFFQDRYQLQEALENGDEWQASGIARDLARDQRALDAILRDIARDHRDIRHDEQELYRGRYQGSGWR